ncbi:unnamed protein product [Moneuplotes crassus]|uniref:A-kinase anchor protein 7-like phosphoesterase domain-containing protein n=1 Tax=Euplotes crassus TaxID=5936 RepID=A0AAD1XGB9_EUPCR|nr:unnamed protein product [Moneuplotes crassus]
MEDWTTVPKKSHSSRGGRGHRAGRYSRGRSGRGDRDSRRDRGNRGERARTGRGFRGGFQGPRLTHFIAIPVEDEGVIENLVELQERLAEEYEGILHPGWMMPSGKFHFTLFVMSLNNHEKVEAAVQTLNDLQPILSEIISTASFTLDLDGIDAFSGRDGKSARVLYAKLKKDESYTLLENIADVVVKKFIEDGIIKETDLDH